MNWNKWLRQIHRWLSIAFTIAVIVNIVTQRGTMRHHDLDPGIERPAQAQRVAVGLRVAALDCLFLAAMDDQRRTGFGQHTIEGIALRIRRVHAHRRRQPFDGARAVGDGQAQFIGRPGSVRMQRGDPFEARREIAGQLPNRRDPDPSPTNSRSSIGWGRCQGL